MNTTQNNQDRSSQIQRHMQPQTQFYIYEDLNLVSNQVFNKNQITIGSSESADLHLDHDAVAEIHAKVDFKDDQIFLTNNYPQDGLRLNGRAVGLAELQHEDVIDIGPFSLKIKIAEAEVDNSVEEDTRFAVRLVNRYSTTASVNAAAEQLAKMLRVPALRVKPLLAKDFHILKRGMTAFKAAQLQNALLKSGVVCDVQQIADVQPARPKPAPAVPIDPPVRKIAVKETFRPIPVIPAPKPAAPKPGVSPASDDDIIELAKPVGLHASTAHTTNSGDQPAQSDFTDEATIVEDDVLPGFGAEAAQPDFTDDATIIEDDALPGFGAEASQPDFTDDATIVEDNSLPGFGAEASQPDFTDDATIVEDDPLTGFGAEAAQPDFTDDATIVEDDLLPGFGSEAAQPDFFDDTVITETESLPGFGAEPAYLDFSDVADIAEEDSIPGFGAESEHLDFSDDTDLTEEEAFPGFGAESAHLDFTDDGTIVDDDPLAELEELPEPNGFTAAAPVADKAPAPEHREQQIQRGFTDEATIAEDDSLTDFGARPVQHGFTDEATIATENSFPAFGSQQQLQPDYADEDPVLEEPPIEVSFTELFEDEPEEDEDDVWEAQFSLKNNLGEIRHQQYGAYPDTGQQLLQVIKTNGPSVVDVKVLTGRKKYVIDTRQGRIKLIDTKRRGESYISILPEFRGYVQSPSGETTADLDSYKIPEYQSRKKFTSYHVPMPQSGTLVIDAEGSRYQISPVIAHPTPEVATVQVPSEFSWRHWATSAGVHFVVVLCLVIYSYFQVVPEQEEEPRFAKLDPTLLEKVDPPPKPKPKEPPPPPPKPEPVRAAEKVKPVKKKPVKKKKRPVRTAKRKTSSKKLAKASGSSRHPNAGGGFGKGNIKNRNINQTGLLSVLGKTSIGGPSQAIASVTNLDAVPVPGGATERNFSVGGVKGALGNGKISVASGGAIMQTKGSKQVLRSAGARGKGQVAALERGTTGRKKVQAMVTAKMSRTVKIEGGMSKAMVKRVIDQHLDEITYCYENALRNNPSILGRIIFEWKIKMNGSVGEIRIVASSVNSHEIHNCIKSAIRSWQFPKPSGAEVVVSYPFVFDLVAF